MTELTKILGGKKQIGSNLNSFDDIDSFIRRGISLTVLALLKKKLQVTDSEIAELIGVSLRTLNRQRAKNQKLSLVASDRVYRVARIYAVATEVLESEEKAKKWLSRSQYGLGGRVPLEVINTEAGAKEVENLLFRIEHGVYS